MCFAAWVKGDLIVYKLAQTPSLAQCVERTIGPIYKLQVYKELKNISAAGSAILKLEYFLFFFLTSLLYTK